MLKIKIFAETLRLKDVNTKGNEREVHFYNSNSERATSTRSLTILHTSSKMKLVMKTAQ